MSYLILSSSCPVEEAERLLEWASGSHPRSNVPQILVLSHIYRFMLKKKLPVCDAHPCALCIDSHSWLKCLKEKDYLKFTMQRTPKLKLQGKGMKLMTEDSPTPLWCRGNLWQAIERSRESVFHVWPQQATNYRSYTLLSFWKSSGLDRKKCA